MWEPRIEDLEPGRLRRVKLLLSGRAAAYDDVLAGWQADPDFRDVFIALLAEVPFEAYLWETPPITKASVARDFECVLVASPALAGLSPDPHSFAAHFDAAGPEAEVVSFANLGADAQLVAPTPRAGDRVYSHLAVFLRGAPAVQRHAFWRSVGAEAAGRLSDRPLWLSTCGLGVGWLHARLDSWPKYYTYRPYRSVGDDSGETATR